MAAPAARAALDLSAARYFDLARIKAVAGSLVWQVRPLAVPGLLQAIVAQQISRQAASAIWHWLQALPGAPTATGLLALGDAALLRAGLSRPKLAHVRALAGLSATAAWASRRGRP